MTEQNQLETNKQALLAGNSTKHERAKMLYEVLLEEYEALGILSVTEIKELRATQKIFAKSTKWGNMDAESEFRFKMLAEIHRKLSQTAKRKFDETQQYYQAQFSIKENKKHYIDDEARQFAIEFATLRELDGSLAKRRKELEKQLADGEDFDIKQKLLSEIYHEAVRITPKEKDKNKPKTNSEKIVPIIDSNSITALCFSGGGIRSATFGLGILQSLAKQGLLDKFHYLSTVSGGGFIGSWLSAWIKRKTLDTVQKNLVAKDLVEGEVEAPEITHLRSYSNYMSPQLGLLSADTWTLIAVYLRNLLLNWTVLIPLITAFLLLPKLFVSS